MSTTIGIPLLSARAVDATDLSDQQRGNIAPSPAGKFKLLPTATGFALVGETPRGGGDTRVDTAILPVVVPSNYVAGSSALAVVLSSAVVALAPGQNLTPASTIGISVSRINVDGTVTVLPVTTAAQNLTTVGVSVPTYSQQTFDIDGSSVEPGDVLLIFVQTSLAVGQAIETKAMICSAQLVYATS
jgi:hypothetical protein